MYIRSLHSLKLRAIIFFAFVLIVLVFLFSGFCTAQSFGLKSVLVKQGDDLTKVLSEANARYVIQYEYNLNKRTLTLGEGSVLEFKGGCIYNGTINGNNSAIDAPRYKIFGTDIKLTGSWQVGNAYPEWFGAKGDGKTDDSKAIQLCVDVFSNIDFATKSYKCSVTINRWHINLIGHQTTFIPSVPSKPILTVFKDVSNGDNVCFFYCKDCNFHGATKSSAIYLRNAHTWFIDHCRIWGNHIGIDNQGAWGGHINNSIVQLNGIGIYAHTDDRGSGREASFWMENGLMDNNDCAIQTSLGRTGGYIGHIGITDVDMTTNKILAQIDGNCTMVFDGIYYEYGELRGKAARLSYVYFNNVTPRIPASNFDYDGVVVIDNSTNLSGNAQDLSKTPRAVIKNYGNSAGAQPGYSYFTGRGMKTNDAHDYLDFNGFKSLYQSLIKECEGYQDKMSNLAQYFTTKDGSSEGLRDNYLHFETKNAYTNAIGFCKTIEVPNIPLCLTFAYRGTYGGQVFICDAESNRGLLQQDIEASDKFIKGCFVIPILGDLKDVKRKLRIAFISKIKKHGAKYFDWGELTLFDATNDINSISIESSTKDPYIMDHKYGVLKPYEGEIIFDAALKKPVFYDGTNWVDYQGNVIK